MNQKTLKEVFDSEKPQSVCQALALESLKHGIELRWMPGRKLKIKSYAVWVKGILHVPHSTTEANRKNGIDLQKLVEIEKRNTGLPII